jgi:hypothetical protein
LKKAFTAFNKPFALITLLAFLFIGCDLTGTPSRASKVTNSEPPTLTHAQTPNISGHPQSAVYNHNATPVDLSVTASVSDGGTLTYQWYINTLDSNSGGTLIEGLDDTNPTFTPIQSGYYYVVVTNTNDSVNGTKTADKTSNAVQVVIPYYVSFYNDQLDLIGTQVADGTIDPNSLRSGTWYKATASSVTTEHNLTANINFYAAQNVKEIRAETELNDVRNDLSGKYILLNDINLTSETLDDSEGWNPIGDDFNAFKGIFNGNRYAIRNLWIDRSTDYVGLFGYTDNAKIKNLGVEINSSKGGVKGQEYVGGIAGYVYYGSSVTDSYSTGNVSGTNQVGGIAGYVYNSSSITNSYSTGNISATGDYVGGIAGRVESSSIITNSYSTGNVSGTNRVGGIAGRVAYSSSITNSYSTGNVSGTNQVGGIAGYVYGSSSTIRHNAAINQEVNGSSYVNRIVGFISGGSAQNNFALDAMTTNGAAFSNPDGTSKSDSDLKTQSTYSDNINGDGLGGLGWQFGNDDDNPWVWGAFDGYPYPTLYWQKVAP